MGKVDLNLKLLQKDINKYLKTFATAYCNSAADNITNYAQSAIQQFYDDYNPKYYSRTCNLLNNSYSRYFHNNGRTMYGGVRISSQNMYENYKGSVYEVAWSGWHGWHGIPSGLNTIKTTAPINMVNEIMSNSLFLHEIKEQAKEKADKQKYNYL